MVVVHPKGDRAPQGTSRTDPRDPAPLAHPAARIPAALLLLVTVAVCLMASRSADRQMPAPRVLAVSLDAAPPAPTDAPAPTTTLDINTATQQQLQLLPRIGPTIAQRIVNDRERHGRYRSVEQLDRVVGIGPKTIERLRPHIRVQP